MKLFNQIYQDLICETNFILPIPQSLFSYLKTKILNMKTMNIFISFSELFEHNCFSDWSEYNKKYLDLIKIKPEEIGKILDSGNRTAAGPTVPPGGLYMTHLWYDDGISIFECPDENS